MKTWVEIEKVFQNARINYQQREWLFLCEIEGAKFYYSPQKQKWRLKETRAWQFTNSAQDFIIEAKEYLRAKKESDSAKSQEKTRNRAKTSNKRNTRKTKKQKKTKKTSQAKNSRQTRWDKWQTEDVVRAEFLELFDEKFKLGIKRGYKPAWIWNSLLEYLLTPSEICWLCTVFGYKPGWAYHQVKYKDPSITYHDILTTIAHNTNDWLSYFNQRWDFAAYDRARRKDERKWQEDWNRQRYHRSSTQTDYHSLRYQSYLDLLQLSLPFSKQELKLAYRKQALMTHPDTGGTPEAFRRVHDAFEILSGLAS